MNKKRRILIWVAVLCVLIFGAAAYVLGPYLEIMTGYAAKNMCSGVFVAGRTPESLQDIDLDFFPIDKVHTRVDHEDRSVTARFLWKKSRAIYREGFGVTLLKDTDEGRLRAQRYPVAASCPDVSGLPWPQGDVLPDSLPAHVDHRRLDSIATELVDRKTYGGTPFAFIVAYRGIPVVEKYAEGFHQDTRLLSWSMAKSITNAMTGILVKDGLLDIYAPTGIAEWQQDERKEITVNDLLQMQSGLEWNENYGGKSDVNLMLHCVGDMAGYTIGKPAAYPHGEKWYYSSGSTNVVSYLLRKTLQSDSLYYDLAVNRLFRRIGIDDAVFETDPTGLMVSSSYVYMNARDFTRFGLLYLNKGMWEGERILPEGWTEYSATPAKDSKGGYGSAFWLNRGGEYKDVPEDMYYCSGHDGQRIVIIPSRELVITLLGYSPKSHDIRQNDLFRDIISAF